MSTPVEHLRMKILRLEQTVDNLAGDEEALAEAIRKIDLDLSNTSAEFAETTGRPESEFWSWRRKAKVARQHKRVAMKEKRGERAEVERQLTNAQMLLYAQEAGYRGQDPDALLRALYHLMMEILGETQYRIDEHQIGLIAAVRDRTEWRPQEVVE